MDEGFISRTYRTSAWVLLLTVLYLAGRGWFQVAWSVAAGAALSLLVLRGFELLVRGALAPERRRSSRVIINAALILKLPLLSLLLFGIVRSGWFHVGAFAGGVALTHAVMFLKAVGIYWCECEREKDKAAARAALRLAYTDSGEE